MRRNITKHNEYPTFVGEYRECNSVLRDESGYIVIPNFNNNQFQGYQLTNLKDLETKPDKDGKRGRNKPFLKKVSNSNIVNNNYSGELFMYCRHCPTQKLLSVDLFTTNKTQETTYVHKDRLCRQSFCVDCKKTYTNSGNAGNSSRTTDQFLEDNGSRLRGLIQSTLGIKNKVNYKKLWEKFGGQCFKCNVSLDIDDTGSKGLDHTLPHSLWWEYNTDNCTLLCSSCNGSKNNKWPGIFYTDDELQRLSEMTGFDYELLKSQPHYNPEVVEKFIDNFDNVLSEWTSWGRKIRKVGNRKGTNKNKEFKKFLLKEINRLKKFNNNKKVGVLIDLLDTYYQSYE